MGATRKLQGEIDRVLKKVQEGVDVFDSIWNKVYDTENANQKEKFEADLKKEIKKLQRYRDQIKTWIQSSEIKDKKALLDARKLIEKEMERFKVCEKETKTKAFSKEGLGLQPKTDPREKAKGESRDWLNNMVSELESQIDSFEAEMEGLSVKKGKARPPRLSHLEESISRHKQHIMKLEHILRLLDNDELSPDEVSDVKDFVEDYVERNQDDFDEFSEVDDLYTSLPLDKMEALETLDASPALPPAILVKEKVAGGAESSDEGVLPEQAVGLASQAPTATQTAATQSPTAQAADPIPVAVTREESPGGAVGGAAVLPRNVGGSSPVGLIPALRAVAKPPSTATVSVVNRPKEDDVSSLVGRPVASAMLEVPPVGTNGAGTGAGAVPAAGAATGAAASGVGIGVLSPARASLGLGGVANSLAGVTGTGIATGDTPKRVGLGGEERITQLALAQNRMLAQTGGKLGDPGSSSEGVNMPDGANRVFSPPIASSGQWRPHLQNSESGQYGYSGRTEVAPDMKQKFLERLQQVQQQNQSGALLNPNVVSKQQAAPPSQPQSSLLQQQMLHQQPQVPLAQPFPSAPTPQQVSTVKAATSQMLSSPSIQAQQQSSMSPSSTQRLPQSSVSLPTAGSSPDKVTRGVEQQLQLADDSAVETPSLNAAFSSSVALISDDDLKNHDTFDVSVAGPGSLGDFRELPRDVDFTPGQVAPVQSLPGPGIIGRRDNLGAIGDNLMLGANATIHDQQYKKDALASAYFNIPLAQDSERPKSYIPRNPVVAPSSYPQVPVPIIDNPALWEHLDTEILFFAFYFQQGTYQQYMAARELKKQSWRYHKKYNTWFQRHKEPKITTDEFEQGTYVYFDFHILHDDHQLGWCQRIKTEFTFEYSYLEDELLV